jgi:hypothetical protein
MSTDKWVELEYQSLRAEILATIETHHSAIRFFLPAAAAVYVVPYFLQQTHDIFLWSVCAGLAGLMITVMNHTLFAAVDSVRRLGAYIKVAIEPRTAGGLGWEAAIYDWDQRTHWWPTEHATTALMAVLANTAAATGAGIAFGGGHETWVPGAIAAGVGALNVPLVFRIWTSARQRRRHAEATVVAISRTIAQGNHCKHKMTETLRAFNEVCKLRRRSRALRT